MCFVFVDCIAKDSSSDSRLKIGPKRCPETSVRTHRFGLRKFPKERRSRLRCSRSMKLLLLFPSAFLITIFPSIFKLLRIKFQFVYATVSVT